MLEAWSTGAAAMEATWRWMGMAATVAASSGEIGDREETIVGFDTGAAADNVENGQGRGTSDQEGARQTNERLSVRFF